MINFIRKFFQPMNRSVGLEERLYPSQCVLLFNSSQAAEESAFMLNGEWDQCNSVVLSRADEVAVNTVASLIGAQWCYSGTAVTLLARLSNDELLRRYAAGERNFSNANLRGARLGELNLYGVNLSWAKLNAATFRRANLSQASFSEADLSEADLSETRMRGITLARAKLTRGNLQFADLEGADLSKANLREANLSGANLRGANLQLADLRGAALADIDFSGANLKGAQFTEADRAEVTSSAKPLSANESFFPR